MTESAVSLSDEFLAREAERTIMDYSWTWEGERETVTNLDGVLMRQVAVPWFGTDGMIVHVDFDPARVDERLDAAIARAEEGNRRFWWVVGPSAQPPDIVERMTARGFTLGADWAGLALRDLSVELPINHAVVVEPLTRANAAEYAAFCASFNDPYDQRVYDERLAAAHRFADGNSADGNFAIGGSTAGQTCILLGRLDGTVASVVVGHIEPSGVVYLRNAITLPAYRRRGLYLTLVAHRLAWARAAGCRAAVVQAQRQSSAPILLKRGFVQVCSIAGLERRREAHSPD